MKRVHLSEHFKLSLLWLTAGTAAMFIALGWLSAALPDGGALPTGHDAFYHARRILDMVSGEQPFHEFDSRIHVPEGSWVPWPWGYDYAMASIARAVSQAGGLPPMQVLVYIPPIFVFVNLALVLAAAVVLGFRTSFVFLVALGFATSPLTLHMHGAGRVDHHFIEQTFVLASLAGGLWFFARPCEAKRGFVLGIVLGCAPAFHSGLFLLQIPLVFTYLILWRHRSLPPIRSTLVTCLSLILALLGILSFSEPFREGLFNYQLLSFFHLYVGSLTCASILLTYRLPPTAPGVLLLAGLGACACVPIAQEVVDGLSFVSRDLAELEKMSEAQSFFTLERLTQSPLDVTQTYGALVWLLPFVIFGSVVTLVRSRERQLIYFCLSALLGIAMMLQQFRFHPFGSFALTMAPLVWLERKVRLPKKTAVSTIVVFVFAATYAPGFPRLMERIPVGNSYDYALVRGIYGTLNRVCARRPGVVLADHNDGHYIRFHSECSVIANNLILSTRSREKVGLANRLLRMNADEFVREPVCVNYLLLRREDNVFEHGTSAEAAIETNAGLRREFLFGDSSDPSTFRVIDEILLSHPVAGSNVLARLVEVRKPGCMGETPPPG